MSAGSCEPDTSRIAVRGAFFPKTSASASWNNGRLSSTSVTSNGANESVRQPNSYGSPPVVRKNEPCLRCIVRHGPPGSRSRASASPDEIHAMNGSVTAGIVNVSAVGGSDFTTSRTSSQPGPWPTTMVLPNAYRSSASAEVVWGTGMGVPDTVNSPRSVWSKIPTARASSRATPTPTLCYSQALSPPPFTHFPPSRSLPARSR